MEKEAKQVLADARADASGERAVLRVLDIVTKTESLALCQYLIAGLEAIAGTTKTFSCVDLLANLSRVASIPELSVEKAEFLGYALGGLALATRDASVDKALARTLQGHPMVLLGVIAFMEEAYEAPGDILPVFQSFFERAVAAPTPLVAKHALVAAWVRMGWRSLELERPTQAASIVLLGVRALSLLPLDSLDNCVIATTLLRGLVDLAPAISDPSPTHALAMFLISVLPHYTAVTSRGGLQLLHILEALVTDAAPSTLSTADGTLLVLLAFSLAATESPTEQRSLLRVLRSWLSALLPSLSRTVYVESLFAPVLALMSTARQPEATEVLGLLQRLHAQTPTSRPTQTAVVDSMHPQLPVATLLQALAVPPARTALLEQWAAATASAIAGDDCDPPVVLAATALLFDARPSVAASALPLVRACIEAWPVAGRLVVPSLVYVLSRSTSGTDTHAVLATLVATAKDAECMKTLLRTVKALTPTHPTTALRLLYRIWTLESRVYSRLEQLLGESHDNDPEWALGQLYTIYELCAVRGDLGLNFVATIQARLEHPLPSLAAVALGCVRALCVADCLDFATACKIIASKLKKNKIPCKDHVLFQVELCQLYAVGGGLLAEPPSFLATLWAATTHAAADVRLAAFTALNAYPLHLVGLKVRSDTIGDDEGDEAAVEAQLHVVLAALDAESVAAPRAAIVALLQRVGADEAAQPRKRFVAERTSGAATRAMANVLPKAAALQAQYKATLPLGLRQALGGAVLTSFVYVPVAADDPLRKRKEKHVKHLEALAADATQLLAQLEDEAKATPEAALAVAHVHAWDRFVHQYVALQRDLEALKGSLDDTDVEALRRAAVALVGRWEPQVAAKPNAALALGVLARLLPSELHVLSARIVAVLLRALQQALQLQAAAAVRDVDAPALAILGLGVALQGALSMHEARVEEVVEKLRGISAAEPTLAPACVLALGHVLPAVMQHGTATPVVEELWRWLGDQLLAAAVPAEYRQSELAAVRVPPGATLSTTHVTPFALLALAMASEGCMSVERPSWLTDLYQLLLQLADAGCADAWTALPPVLLQGITFELLGWADVDAFVAKCQAAVDAAVPQALAALPYLLCRTQALGHAIAPDVPAALVDRLDAIAHDSARAFDAAARSYAALGLANVLGTSLAVDGRPGAWKGLLVGASVAGRIVATLESLCALCPLQRVRIHAAWALGTLAALAASSESFQIKSRGIDAGLQLPSTTLTYKLLDRLRQLKNPAPADALWVAAALTVLADCQVPTFQYATLLLRFWNAKLGVDVTLAALAFAAGHCSQDPSLLSFLLDLSDRTRFRPLAPAVQRAYVAQLPALARLIAPPQLDMMLVHLVAATATPELAVALLEALAACATALTAPPALAVCATAVADALFRRLVELRAPESAWGHYAAAARALDAGKARTALVAATESPDAATARSGCLALGHLMAAGGCGSKELQAVVRWLAAGRAPTDEDAVIVRTVRSAQALAPLDKWWWLHNVLHSIGLSQSPALAAAARRSPGLRHLLAALCVAWHPTAAAHAALFVHAGLGTLEVAAAHALPVAFADVLASLRPVLPAEPRVDLVDYVEQLLPTPDRRLWAHILRYAYTVHGGLRLEVPRTLDALSG
ncbi:hypothetical protein ACHHYP_00697 [Achlya hypogyna]|uniref:DUF3730 domain-containing protein n=1 Tax=Achlya hypogyna TaxID=1202772 RepID=A0A1V9ZU14_ACHHY|nr:hypothetical protein ACHHYP_00697 [Achlya hypogyna]